MKSKTIISLAVLLFGFSAVQAVGEAKEFGGVWKKMPGAPVPWTELKEYPEGLPADIGTNKEEAQKLLATAIVDNDIPYIKELLDKHEGLANQELARPYYPGRLSGSG